MGLMLPLCTIAMRVGQELWNLQIDWILETHVHADHLSGAPYIASQLGGRTAIGCRVGTVSTWTKNRAVPLKPAA